MIPAALREKLVLNGCRAIRDQAFDPYPVVKIFAPNGYATWLLTETDPAAQIVHMAFATSGLGSPELGYVSLFELASYRSRFGLPLERDRHFHAWKPILEYAAEARVLGRIVA
jgi:hypothetical protein